MENKFQEKEGGVLYIVATPIGNLKDITLRALEVLRGVDLIACEDTRVTSRLLHHFQIKTKTISLHQHSNREKIGLVINKLKQGENIAYVTDSGTPGISDPGAKLIKSVLDYVKIKVVSIPGPSALTAALSISGAPSKNILFIGFIPQKNKRQKKLTEIEDYWKKGLTIIFFESPYRIKKTLEEIVSRLDNAEITVLREISKKFEETIIVGGMGKEDQIKKITARGEFTVVLKGKEKR